MSRRRRAALLAGLAILLGALAAADVAGREADLRAQIGDPIPVVLVAKPVRAGRALQPGDLAVRRVPARYAPRGSYAAAAEVAGRRAAVPLPAGTDLAPALLQDPSRAVDPGAPVRPGERIAELIARGSADLVRTGARVDVVITRERADGQGATTLALEDAEVLRAAAAPSGDRDDAVARVAVALRVTVRQAVELTAAQDFGHELRVLPRAAGDRRRGLSGLAVRSVP